MKSLMMKKSEMVLTAPANPVDFWSMESYQGSLGMACCNLSDGCMGPRVLSAALDF